MSEFNIPTDTQAETKAVDISNIRNPFIFHRNKVITDFEGLSVIFYMLKDGLEPNSVPEFCVDSYFMNNVILSIQSSNKTKQVSHFYGILKSCTTENNFLSDETKKSIYDIFSKAIWTNNKLRTFMRFYRQKKLTDSEITTDLYMNDLTDYSEQLKIDIIENNTLYHFRLTDLLTIITKSLLNYDDVGLIKPLMPKNPYTNIEFSKANLYNIFYKAKESTILIPLLFHKFYLKHFNIRDFTIENDTYLINKSVINHIDNSSDYDIYLDILNLLENFKRKLTLINVERMLRTVPVSVLINELKSAIKYYYLTKYSNSIMTRRDSGLKIEKILAIFNNKYKNKEPRVSRRYFSSARRNLFGIRNRERTSNESDASDMSIDNNEEENKQDSDEEENKQDNDEEENKQDNDEDEDEDEDEDDDDDDDDDGITVEIGISAYSNTIAAGDDNSDNSDNSDDSNSNSNSSSNSSSSSDSNENEENKVSNEEIDDSNIILSRSILNDENGNGQGSGILQINENVVITEPQETMVQDTSVNSVSPTEAVVSNYVNNLINENISQIAGELNNIIQPPTQTSNPLTLTPIPSADLFRYIPSPRRGRLRRTRRSPRGRTRTRITSPSGFMNRSRASDGYVMSTEVGHSPLASIGLANRIPTPRPVHNSFTPYTFLDPSNNSV